MSGVTARELFRRIMRYEEVDRMPVFHWKGWPETNRRWEREGIPPGTSQHEFFNAVPQSHGAGVNVGLYPAFEEETLEETAEYRVFRQSDGVIAKHWKNRSSIPHFIDYTLKDRASWEEYKKRLQPDPGRIPENYDKWIEDAKQAEAPVTAGAASMAGWVRNWMGVENMSYMAYDDRELFMEMADTIADLVVWGLEQTLPRVNVDMAWGWEDICFRTGPLVSPEIFKDVAVPAYRKIADKLHEHGVDLYLVDCDGMIEDLIPLWLEAGVNVMFPLEIGAWKADPMVLRKKFGKELRIFGGIDKLEIAKGRAAIDREIGRRLPLMKEGGFVPLPDHLLTPGTALEDYQYYLEKLRGMRF